MNKSKKSKEKFITVNELIGCIIIALLFATMLGSSYIRSLENTTSVSRVEDTTSVCDTDYATA